MISDKKHNYLINEKSPYLLQHAYNPVNWYSWCNEAFDKAKRENKPIFLSIGYSTCHWCHVMAHESFEDKEIASLLNEHFISIKVDREERPDIDSIYMTFCQKTTGRGGWPLTIFMTPDQKPFFAGTYFPKENRYGTIGLISLLDNIANKWSTEKEKIISTSNKILISLENDFKPTTSTEELSKKAVKDGFLLSSQLFEPKYGGFASAPKFPAPHKLMFLLNFGIIEDMINPTEMVEKTLISMFKGGLYDHVGFGFSRYSTDDKWLVPHFEKMLYDNALLILAYLDIYQVTKNPLYKRIVINTFDFIIRDMTSEDYSFYSALDADSDGEEGKFYTFTYKELLKLLGEDDGNYFNEYFNVTEEGNFEGKNILNLLGNYNYNKEDERINSLRKKVFDYRNKRFVLNKDDKVLTSWNALTIAAFARGYKILNDEKYLDIANKNLSFIKAKLIDKNGRLLARYRDGEAKYKAYLDDYAYLIFALLELYEATFDIKYLEDALNFKDDMIKLFWDTKDFGFYLYGNDSETLIVNPKEIYDGALPSGNSVASYVLVKLSKLTGDSKLIEITNKQLTTFYSTVKNMPMAYTFYLMALLLELYPSKELICVTENVEDIKALKSTLSNKFIPNLNIIVKTIDNKDSLQKLIPYSKNYNLKNNKTTYYLCEDNNCSSPSNDLLI
ncbi:thioredoxin domain-containing protein [Clostridium chauvoei]|uniref:thioredoxin domain-containing protein n=1 Tax=Clostridium chauvoei TaxID=46867 RepID=UPI001C85580E|nr:thioredoxin domain-containing protein [Clostridium chauvoei]MBX7394028.1 thioredoxin domain-containing protein [Clostridium chauvoei]